MKYTALLLLAIWLIAGALLGLTHWHFAYEKPIMAILALASGIILLLSLIKLRFGDIGLLLLSTWLLLQGCVQLFHLAFPYSSIVTSILAIAAGIFLLIRK